MEDEQIIELYFSRSEDAVLQTSKKHGSMCRRVAYNILRNSEDSEECVNDTWLKAWKSIPPVRPNCLAAFLAKITRNLALNRWRNREKNRGIQTTLCLEELSECIPDAHGEISEDLALTDAINRFLAALKPDARKIFVQRYWYVCTVKEIARELSISEGAVKMRLSRIRGELKQFFEKEGIEI